MLVSIFMISIGLAKPYLWAFMTFMQFFLEVSAIFSISSPKLYSISHYLIPDAPHGVFQDVKLIYVAIRDEVINDVSLYEVIAYEVW